jgi:hypothetical protein
MVHRWSTPGLLVGSPRPGLPADTASGWLAAPKPSYLERDAEPVGLGFPSLDAFERVKRECELVEIDAE